MSAIELNPLLKEVCAAIQAVEDNAPRMIHEVVSEHITKDSAKALGMNTYLAGQLNKDTSGKSFVSALNTLLYDMEKSHGRAFTKAVFSEDFLTQAHHENRLNGANYIMETGTLDMVALKYDLIRAPSKKSNSSLAALSRKIEDAMTSTRAGRTNMADNKVVFKSVDHFVMGANHILNPFSKGFDGATPNYLSKAIGIGGLAAVADGSRRILFGERERQETGRRETPYGLALGEIACGSVAFMGVLYMHGRNATNLGSHYTRKIAEALKDTGEAISK